MIRACGRAVSTLLSAAVVWGGFFALTALAEEAPVETATQSQTVTTEPKSSFSLFSRFPVVFSLSVDGGYDTNPGTSSGSSRGSVFDSARGNLSYEAGTQRWHLTLTAVTEVVYFFDNAPSTNPEVNTSFQLAGHYNVSDRLTLSLGLTGSYQAEPDFSANIGPNRRAGYFFTTTDTLSASYQWTPLISTVSSEMFMLVNYDDAMVGAFADRIENTLDQQVLFHLSLRTALVAEYRFQVVDYKTFPHDSTSNYVLGGIDHSFNSRVNVSLRGGVNFRSYTGGSTKTAPQFDGTLNYAIGRKSSLSWITHYGLEAPDSPTVANTTAFRTGVQLQYGLTPRIISTVGAYYIHNDNQSFSTPGIAGMDTSDDTYDVSLNVQYSLNRHWAFHVGFDASGTNSNLNSPTADYSRQRYSAGLNFTF